MVIHQIVWKQIFDLTWWKLYIDVEKEVKGVYVVDCWMDCFDVGDFQMLLLALFRRLEVDWHPRLYKAWREELVANL